jgi:hypothetical protein
MINPQYLCIDYDKLDEYCSFLDIGPALDPVMDIENHFIDTSYFLLLDAVNFGSGYFDRLDLQPGLSGYFTVSSLLKEYFIVNGPPAALDILNWDRPFLARVFKQNPANTHAMELIDLFLKSLKELARFIIKDHSASFSGFVKSMDHSAEKMVTSLGSLSFYNDRAVYNNRVICSNAESVSDDQVSEEFEVIFLKRAQITVSDLYIAYGGAGQGRFDDIDNLTIFADNLVPHVLWKDKILKYSKELKQIIYNSEPIKAGSKMEIELRAAAVHAAELIKARFKQKGVSLTSQQLDYFLWNRGQSSFYNTPPAHLCRNIYY